jgi:hypothetical protein
MGTIFFMSHLPFKHPHPIRVINPAYAGEVGLLSQCRGRIEIKFVNPVGLLFPVPGLPPLHEFVVQEIKPIFLFFVLEGGGPDPQTQ